MTSWAFVKTDNRLGSWGPPSREYVITPQGTWVPAVDVDWLLTFKKRCPCRPGAGPMQIVSRARPTAEQMKQMPEVAPAPMQSNFGLAYIGG